MRTLSALMTALILTAGVAGSDPMSDYVQGLTLAHVVCDGEGDYVYALDFDNPELREGTVLCYCIEEHEKEHIRFLEHAWPDLCAGKPEGHRVGLPWEAKQQTECLAYLVTRQCFLAQGRERLAIAFWKYAEARYGCDFEMTKTAYKREKQERKEPKDETFDLAARDPQPDKRLCEDPSCRLSYVASGGTNCRPFQSSALCAL